MGWWKSFSSLVISFGLFPCAYAQQIVNASTLEPMVITADPLGGTEANISQPVSILKREHILTQDLRNIGEAVAQELGVSASDFGPAVGRPVIRGLGGARVRVLEDGISTLDVSTISPDHAVAAEMLFADQIEIFRGPSTLLYGSGASGGVVNIVNHRILDYVPDEMGGDLYGHYNSVADDFTGAFRLNAGAGNFAFHLNGMKRHTGNYAIPGFADIDPETDAKKGVLENSDVQTENFSTGMSYVGKRGVLGVAVSRFTNHYGVPGHDHFHHDEHGSGSGESNWHDDHWHDAEEGVDHHDDHVAGDHEAIRVRQRQTRFDIKGVLNDPLPGFQTAKTRWGYNNHTHKELEGGKIETLLINREWEGRVEMLHKPLAGWDGVLGMQYQNRNLSTSGEAAFVPNAQADSLSIFLLEKLDVENWHFEMGGRFEHQQAERKDDYLKAAHDVFSISGGLIWEFIEGYSLGSNISHSQRAPALEELFSDGPHLATNTFEVGDASLVKEKSNSLDLFLRKQNGDLNWTLNLFANLINDFIFLQESDLTGDGLADRVSIQGIPGTEGLLLLHHRQSNANFLGIEFETIAHLLNDNRGRLDLRLWTDYTRGRLSGGRYIPRMTPLRFGGALDYRYGPWHSKIDVMRVHKQTEITSLETPTAGYTMLTIQLDYKFDWGPINCNLFARGTNLLNEEARRHTSFLKDRAPLPGRSAMVGLRVSF